MTTAAGQDNVVSDGYYDALYLYGNALSTLSKSDRTNQTKLLTAMKSRTVDGPDRTIIMDPAGDQKMEFTMHCPKGGAWVPCMDTVSTLMEIEFNLLNGFTNNSLWAYGVPEGSPHCGLDGSLCVGKTTMTTLTFSLVISGVFLIIAIIFVIAFLCYRNWKKHNVQEGLTWLIPEDEIKVSSSSTSSSVQVQLFTYSI